MGAVMQGDEEHIWLKAGAAVAAVLAGVWKFLTRKPEPSAWFLEMQAGFAELKTINQRIEAHGEALRVDVDKLGAVTAAHTQEIQQLNIAQAVTNAELEGISHRLDVLEAR